MCRLLIHVNSQRDPSQMHNYFADESSAKSYELFNRPFSAVIDRLDALLVILKECKGRTCTDPWETHGQKSLKCALNPKLDAYFLGQPKVAFSSCELGYIREAEQNQAAIGTGSDEWSDQGYGEGEQQQTFKYNGRWHDWV